MTHRKPTGVSAQKVNKEKIITVKIYNRKKKKNCTPIRVKSQSDNTRVTTCHFSLVEMMEWTSLTDTQSPLARDTS